MQIFFVLWYAKSTIACLNLPVFRIYLFKGTIFEKKKVPDIYLELFSFEDEFCEILS